MKTSNKALIGLIIVSIFQLAFPLLFISAKERVIEKGKEYVFNIQPIDPYNFFQGRYVSLKMESLAYSDENWKDFKRFDMVYVEFDQDSTGTRIKKLSHEKSKYSLKLKLYAEPGSKMQIRLPFKKFFLEEYKAQSIENRLGNAPTGSCFVHARILNGDFVLTDISSNGKSLITGNPVKFRHPNDEN